MGIIRNAAYALTATFGLAASVPIGHLMQGHLTYGPMPDGEKADVVMVFTGESNRIVHGFNVIEAGMGGRLMISGRDYAENSLEDDIKAVADKVQTKDLFIDYDAASTIENAVNSTEWALKNKVRSIVLITSNEHMARAYFEMRRLLPDDIRLYTDTVEGLNLGTGLDSEQTRLACRLYESVLQQLLPSSGFCYQTRNLARHWGVLAMNWTG